MSDTPNPRPDNGGLRFDANKLRLDLIPPEWELELGRVTTAGAVKYAPRNWERGMAWMKMIGCAKRHILKFLLRESYDPETGAHHLALAAWNLLALMSYEMRRLGEDDRPPSVQIGPNFERISIETDADQKLQSGRNGVQPLPPLSHASNVHGRLAELQRCMEKTSSSDERLPMPRP